MDKRIKKVENEIKKIASEFGLEYQGARFLDKEGTKDYISDCDDALGGFQYEGSDLFYVMNGYDINGSFDTTSEIFERIYKTFGDNGLWFERYDNCSALIWEL